MPYNKAFTRYFYFMVLFLIMDIDDEMLTCCDCGKEFVVDGMVKNKKRCDECQKKHRNNSQKELMKSKRAC